MSEITNKEKLIIIFEKTLPKCSIGSVHIKNNGLAFNIINFKANFSINVYKNGEYNSTDEDYREDDNSGEALSGNVFSPLQSIMPDRFNSISESQLFPISTIGMPHMVVVKF